MTGTMTEDRLVQKTTADYFHTELGWDSVYAYNEETYGEDSTLGRSNQNEVILSSHLKEALKKFNQGLPDAAYNSAVKTIIETSVSKSTLQINREKYKLFKDGVKVKFKNNQGAIEKRRLKIFDFKNPKENHFLVAREMWIKRAPYRRRPDIVGFVNGIPLLFIELKNIHKDIRRAYM